MDTSSEGKITGREPKGSLPFFVGVNEILARQTGQPRAVLTHRTEAPDYGSTSL